jgi:hypothetical protein
VHAIQQHHAINCNVIKTVKEFVSLKAVHAEPTGRGSTHRAGKTIVHLYKVFLVE